MISIGELVGICGMALLVVSYIQSSKIKLHLIALISSVLLLIYAVFISNTLFSVLNLFLVIINSKQYVKLTKKEITNGQGMDKRKNRAR